MQRIQCPRVPSPWGPCGTPGPALPCRPSRSCPSSSTDPAWVCYRPALSVLTLHSPPFPRPSLVHLLQTTDSPAAISSPGPFPEPLTEQQAPSMHFAPGRPAPGDGPVTLPKVQMFTRAPDSQGKDSPFHRRRETCTQVLLCGSLCPRNTGALPCSPLPGCSFLGREHSSPTFLSQITGRLL